MILPGRSRQPHIVKINITGRATNRRAGRHYVISRNYYVNFRGPPMLNERYPVRAALRWCDEVDDGRPRRGGVARRVASCNRSASKPLSPAGRRMVELPEYRLKPGQVKRGGSAWSAGDLPQYPLVTPFVSLSSWSAPSRSPGRTHGGRVGATAVYLTKRNPLWPARMASTCRMVTPCVLTITDRVRVSSPRRLGAPQPGLGDMATRFDIPCRRLVSFFVVGVTSADAIAQHGSRT
jgi:hypothetical protein